jgi:hypothetical protein
LRFLIPIDGGSVLPLMPLQLAKGMKLRLELGENLMIKTATAETSIFVYSVMIGLEISGIRDTLYCYCIPEHI